MDSLFAINYSWLIPLLPLAGACIAGLFGSRLLKQQSHWPIWLGVGASAVISIMLLAGMTSLPHSEGHLYRQVDWYTWIHAGPFTVTAGFFFDSLTAIMLCVVTVIGFLITVFSKGYMAGEKGYFRFFAYLGLFIFSMTILVMADNFVLLYLGWEGVGLCSYLLIGYYYERPAAREAAKKAFLVNRIGDFSFALGIMLIFTIFGKLYYFGQNMDGVLVNVTDPAFIAHLPAWQQHAIHWIPFLLMFGAFGKSAQFPLYIWLPDAMEGPTPVSALIHAATMVTAGVYMIVRCSTLFIATPASLWTIAAVGAFTALLGATIALRQFDLKKVFAYSTISQLGYMFVGAAVLAPVAAIFHLATHAFFKALLFLASGVVMHAMAGELDMRKMSGLRHVLPWTNRFMLVGCLALAGFPAFSGFFSKDEIVAAAFARHWALGVVLLFAAFLTAYYTFRLYFRVFQGPEVIPPIPGGFAHEDKAEEHAHASTPAVHTGTAGESGVDKHLHGAGHGARTHHSHEPLSMVIPLFLLTIGAFAAGYMNWPNEKLGEFLGQSPSFSAGYNYARTTLQMPEGEVIEPAGFGQPLLHPNTGKPLERPPFTPVMGISAAIAAAGILLAYLLHLKDRAKAEQLAERYPLITRILEAKYWVDEIYQAAIIQPLHALAEGFFWIDRAIIDGLVWLAGFVPQLTGFSLRLTTQRGSLQGYALSMLGAIAIILLVVFLR